MSYSSYLKAMAFSLTLSAVLTAETHPLTSTTEVRIGVALLETGPDGPTRRIGTATQSLGVDATGYLLVETGQLSDSTQRCSSHLTAGPHLAPSLKGSRSRLGGPGFSWYFVVSPIAVKESSATVRIRWSESTFDGGEPPPAQTEEWTIPIGQSRHLGQVEFEERTDRDPCSGRKYQLEVFVEPTPHQTMQHHPLLYEIWCVESSNEQDQRYAVGKLRGAQAEEVTFTSESLARREDQVTWNNGATLVVGVQCAGKLRAWSTTPETLTLQIEPEVRFWFGGEEQRTAFSTGLHATTIRTGFGETTEIRIPTFRSWTHLLPSELRVGGAGVDWLTVANGRTAIDGQKLFADTNYSIYVRVLMD